MHDGGFPVEVIDDAQVIATPGEIDVSNAEALRSALLDASANGQRTLVVDMTRTQFCDLSGLHALVAAHHQASASGHEVLLVISSTAIFRVLGLTGMDRLIPNFTTLDQALAHTDALDDQPRHDWAAGTPSSAPAAVPQVGAQG